MPQGPAAQGSARGSGGQGFLEVPQHHLLVGLEKGELEEASLLPVPPPPKHHRYTKAAPGLAHDRHSVKCVTSGHRSQTQAPSWCQRKPAWGHGHGLKQLCGLRPVSQSPWPQGQPPNNGHLRARPRTGWRTGEGPCK